MPFLCQMSLLKYDNFPCKHTAAKFVGKPIKMTKSETALKCSHLSIYRINRFLRVFSVAVLVELVSLSAQFVRLQVKAEISSAAQSLCVSVKCLCLYIQW